jgi:hypothetical protein
LLFAAFLVTVGIPLMAMGVDVSRVYLMNVRLRNATEAACQAYANSLDIRAFQMQNELKFTKGPANAYKVFNGALGDNASFVPVVERHPGEGVDIGGGKKVEIIVVRCFGTAFVDAVVPFWGNYTVTSTSSVKTKFSTTKDLGS